MALLPYLFRDDWDTPSLFGRDWDRDSFQPLLMPRSWLQIPENFVNFAANPAQDTVAYDKDKFQVNFDVQHFKPEEIKVKYTGSNTITIEAEHEEKQDDHGQIYRHFVRKYTVPESYDMNQLQSKLSSDGVLTITAPKTGDDIEHRTIPIIQTKQLAKSIEQKKEGKKLKKAKI